MSTRRARIKAVTSLPVRRKNAEANNNPRNKQPIQHTIEKVVKSPRTPRTALKTELIENKSPVIKTSPILISNEVSTVITCTTPKELFHNCDVKVSIEDSPTVASTPHRAEKVSVITPNLNYKPTQTNSPCTIGDFASPLVPSPIGQSKTVGVIVQRPNTPLKEKTPLAHTIDENNELQITSKHVNSVVYNSVSSKSVVSDDYNVPSVPESVPAENEGVMDGIIPLQAESNIPKPIDLLKNEIISENAEVLFDPIIPLPSPSKVRPKLRPRPRLGPLRRNSVQGSASESEDESRRALLHGANTSGFGRQRHDSHTSLSTLNSVPNRDMQRTRNDSVCSSVSQVNGQPTTSPVKEKNSAKNRRKEVSRRMAAVRRRKETLQRETLTMYDLIFYNPTSNPIVPNQDEVKAKEANKRDEEKAMKDKEEEKKNKDEKKIKVEKTKEEKKDDKTPTESTSTDSLPVPQIKIGPNGEIVIDKSSLVINQTEANRKVSVVREGSWGGGGGRYMRMGRTAEWPASETVRFYRALAALGTDFSMMAPLFPDRTRRELKLKFKKEERINGAQVDKALRSGNSWDPGHLKEEFQNERQEAVKKAKRAAEKLEREKLAERERMRMAREVRVRSSRASKALQSTMLPGMSKQKIGEIVTADDFVNRALAKKLKKKSPVANTSPAAPTNNSSMATLTLINGQNAQNQTKNTDNMATLSRVSTPVANPPLNLNTMPNVPTNIETGSLVVLTLNDPASPSKKMLQTYIAHSAGRLTPVALPPTFLNSVVGYMKKGTPKSNVSSSSSPQLTSPSSVISQDSVSSLTGTATPVHMKPSPVKRKRMSSYTITQL